jgi:hypothetical protein
MYEFLEEFIFTILILAKIRWFASGFLGYRRHIHKVGQQVRET